MYNTLIKSLVLGPQNWHQNWKFASVMASEKKISSPPFTLLLTLSFKQGSFPLSQLNGSPPPHGSHGVCPQVRTGNGGQRASDFTLYCVFTYFSCLVSTNSSFVKAATFNWTKLQFHLDSRFSWITGTVMFRRWQQWCSAKYVLQLWKAKCMVTHNFENSCIKN